MYGLKQRSYSSRIDIRSEDVMKCNDDRGIAKERDKGGGGGGGGRSPPPPIVPIICIIMYSNFILVRD